MTFETTGKSNGIQFHSSRCAMLIVDMQDKLLTAIENSERIIWNNKRLIDAAKILDIPILFTEQNPNKLGSTNNSLISLSDRMPIPKMSFSCLMSEAFTTELGNTDVKSIVLSGVETHVCIQQTALDLLNKDYKVCLPIDASGSRNRVDNETAIRRLENAGVIITTTEAIIFELCKTADRPEFKAVSQLIQRSLNNR